MADLRLLLLSNSRNAGQGYLEHAHPLIADVLGPSVRRVLFIPYASVGRSLDDYEALVRNSLSVTGYDVISIHHSPDPRQAVTQAEAIAVGGGNTFHLLRALYEADLLEAIRERVRSGIPYIGWSAGSNLACPTIKTTNDMPIVEPPSLRALGLVGFQINPHYLDAHPAGHQGETREERILEFLSVNPGVRVVGLREGSALSINGSAVRLTGPKTARVYMHGETPRECAPGLWSDFS